jgi:hypothetical protein
VTLHSIEATSDLELSLRPRLEQVWAVRQLIETHYGPILHDADLIGRLGIASHELLENAAKYGADGLSSLEIAIAGGAGSRRLQITVVNPTNHQKVAELQRFFDDMARAGDPFAFYQMRMERAAKLKNGSGLGLARISFEAEMTLSMAVDDQHVRMTAVAPLPGTEART